MPTRIGRSKAEAKAETKAKAEEEAETKAKAAKAPLLNTSGSTIPNTSYPTPNKYEDDDNDESILNFMDEDERKVYIYFLLFFKILFNIMLISVLSSFFSLLSSLFFFLATQCFGKSCMESQNYWLELSVMHNYFKKKY